ncbi:hypothetical protein NIES593_22725 [Hydrococcus rivularis NIES-593]|uniref:Uncharacterized protein n=2 Tax=Cyanophyceae TaxID=3028117 RepID=A0A1U7H700_9CYAN|nr:MULTISPECIES: hypothetical protein [Cyanophyceae]OKH10813.1 hypothetical protein NIES592_23840 [Fischerella major NIES-592]OKH17837.1 hypothetical protein NIES593_22725 [Hydrococcus rivularis NIES-593]
MKKIAINQGESLKILTSVGTVEFIPLEDVAGYCLKISSSGEAIAEVIEELPERITVALAISDEESSVEREAKSTHVLPTGSYLLDSRVDGEYRVT